MTTQIFECQFPNKTGCKSSLGCNACEVAWADACEKDDAIRYVNSMTCSIEDTPVLDEELFTI
jgi:hypothetical protein